MKEEKKGGGAGVTRFILFVIGCILFIPSVTLLFIMTWYGDKELLISEMSLKVFGLVLLFIVGEYLVNNNKLDDDGF